MYDNLIAWGQAYGLVTTICLLCFICITQYIDNSRLKKALEKARNDLKKGGKIG